MRLAVSRCENGDERNDRGTKSGGLNTWLDCGRISSSLVVNTHTASPQDARSALHTSYLLLIMEMEMELHGTQITWIGTFVSINFHFRFLSVSSIHVSQVMLPHFD